MPTTNSLISQHLRRNSYAPKLDDFEFSEICQRVDGLRDDDLDVAEKVAAQYTQDIHGEWSTTDARAQRYLSTVGSFVALGIGLLATGALGTGTSAPTRAVGALIALSAFGMSALSFVGASLVALWAVRSTPTPVELPVSALARDPSFSSLRAQWIARSICRSQEAWLVNERRTVLLRRAEWAYLTGFVLIAVGTVIIVVERLK